MIDLQTPIDEVALAFLDVETTGLNSSLGDRVCEIAVLRCQYDDPIDAIEQLINPQRHIGAGAAAVNGLSDEDLADAPPFAQVAGRVLAILDGAVLVGHNTAFDLGFLASELGRLGVRQSDAVALDTLRLAKYSYQLPSYALRRVAAALGVDIAGRAHRAMHDVLLTRSVFTRLQDHLYAQGIRTLGDFIRAQGGHVALPVAPVYNIPPLVQQALEESLLLRLRYLSEQGVETVRMVRPLAISLRGGHVSLVAHCYLRDAHRHFRLDRIVDIELAQGPT